MKLYDDIGVLLDPKIFPQNANHFLNSDTALRKATSFPYMLELA